MKNLVPHGNMVLLVFEKVSGGSDDMFVKAPKSNILVPNGMETGTPGAPVANKPKYRAKVSAVGELVDLSKANWKVGDLVIYNDYDLKTFAPPEGEEVYGLLKAENIWATYEE
jgi:co-chaperonin GroES (HSP10)